MTKSVELLVKFNVSYKTKAGTEGTWSFHGKFYPSGVLKVFDPKFKAIDCDKAHFLRSKVFGSITNKGNRIFALGEIVRCFADIGIREPFFPFEEIHFGYKDAYFPRIELFVKMDKDLWERPVQIKADYSGKWIQCTTENHVLVVDKKYVHRTILDD